MKMTVVIPTHNRFNSIVRLIKSIATQDLNERKIELIVVSNLEDNRLSTFIKNLNYPITLTYLVSGRTGVNLARNLGVKHARSEWIYFLDDDVELLSTDHLQQAMRLTEKYSSYSAIGGSYTPGSKASALDLAYYNIATQWLDEKRGHLVGGNTLYHYGLLKEQLHFNDQIEFGGSETELNLRILNSGGTFKLSQELNVGHVTDLRLLTFIKKAIRQGQGRAIHESVAASGFWSHDSELKEDSFYNSLYNFFFHAGYRKQISGQNLLICMVKTFFQIDAGNVLNTRKDQTAFHQYPVPEIKFRELHHWMKFHVWWKIPNKLFWKIIPGAGNLLLNRLPFNSMPLRKSYHRIFSKIEKFLQRN